MFYTDNPERDMEYEYASRPETIGTCPFCLEIVQKTYDEDGKPIYIHGYGRRNYAHRECLERYDRLRADYPLFF